MKIEMTIEQANDAVTNDGCGGCPHDDGSDMCGESSPETCMHHTIAAYQLLLADARKDAVIISRHYKDDCQRFIAELSKSIIAKYPDVKP